MMTREWWLVHSGEGSGSGKIERGEGSHSIKDKEEVG